MKKKEIIIIILIISLTIILSSSSFIIGCFKKEDEVVEQKEEKRFITLSFKGELIKEVEFKFERGVSFGYVYKYLNNYLNSYSIIDIELTTTYLEDEIIYIKSNDYKNEEEIVNENEGKIDINNAEIDELTTIYGIGIKRANRIIEARKTKKISSWTELKSLIEVSNEVMDKIKEQAFL